MHKLVLIRHGESTWNKEGRFTGWTDVDLSDKGREEARAAGQLLKHEGYGFDLVFTSLLKRAIRTSNLVLDELDQLWLPVQRSWRLNERHYGALQGLNKAETAAKHGDEQVKIWRRAYDIPPPPLTPDDPRHPSRDPRYRNLAASDLPLAESLKDTVTRFLPYWNDSIAPTIAAGQRVIVVPRQLVTSAGEVLGWGLGLGHRRAEHPDGHSVGLRVGCGVEAAQELLPGGRRGRKEGGRRGRQSGGAAAVTVSSSLRP